MAGTTAVGSEHRPRRGRPGYDLETLLEVCVREFNDRGYEGTSIGDLADALHVSKSAIYHHVSSKEELLQLAVDRALAGLEELIEGLEEVPGPGIERIRELLRRSVDLLLDEQPYVTLLLRLRGNSPAELDAMARRRAATKRIEQVVRQAQADGTMRDDLGPRSVTRLLLGMVNSLIDWYRVDGPADRDALKRVVLAIAIEGVGPQHAPAALQPPH